VALFIYRTMRPRVSLLVRLKDGRLGDAHLHPDRPRCPKILLVRQYMLLYFANAGHFENRLLQTLAEFPEACCVILDFSAVNIIDYSGIDALSELVERLRAQGIRFSIARANHHVTEALRRAGLVSDDGEEGIRLFNRPTEAICHALAHIRCRHCDDGKRCPLRRPDFNPAPCPGAQPRQLPRES
jgi:SulP family sulfate permease